MKCAYPLAVVMLVGLCAEACDSAGSGNNKQTSPSASNGQNTGPVGGLGADAGSMGSSGPTGQTGSSGSTGSTGSSGSMGSKGSSGSSGSIGSSGSGSMGAPAADGGPITVPPAASQLDCGPSSSDWPMFGQNICNTASQSAAGGIDVNTVKNLKPKWTYSASGDVSATPAVVGNAVYVPDWGGTVARVDATTGKAVWSKSVTDLMGSSLTGFFSRTAPVVTTDSVYLGTQRPSDGAGPSAFVIALDPATGALKWKTQMETDVYAVITSSPVFDQGTLYVGVSSLAETKAGDTFRGSVAALDGASGNIKWQTHTISDAATGFTGAAVWSSSPTVDRKRKQLYVTTGNNYSGGLASAQGNYVDAVIALDLATGAIKWGSSLPRGGTPGATDVFPSGGGADSDFGAGANLFTATIGGQLKDLVGAGQKSGYYFAFDPDTGQTVWQTQTGPGGVAGGIDFGTATDGYRIYVETNDSLASSWTIAGSGSQAGTSSTSGFWAALDPADGHILWQIANPALSRPATGGASTDGPVVVVNGVLFGGSMDSNGTMFAMNAATGEVLWSHQSGGSVYGGPAVANGVVYWGCGYSMGTFGTGTSCAQLYAFSAQ